MKTAYPAVSRPGSHTFRFPVNVHLPLLFRPASFRLPVVRMGGILFLVMAAAVLSVSAQDIDPGPGGEGGPCQFLALPGPPCSRAEAYRLQRETLLHSPVPPDREARMLRERQLHCLDLLLAEAERECAFYLSITPPSPTTPASGGTSGYPGPKPPETPADCHLPRIPDIADPCSRVRFIHDILQRMQQDPGTPAHCLDIVKRLYLEESQACEHTRSSDTGHVTASQGNGNYPPGDKPQHPDLSHAPVHPGPYRTFKPGIPNPMSPPCAYLYQMLQAARERQAGRLRGRSLDQIEQRFLRLCGDIPAPATGTVMAVPVLELHGPHIPPRRVMMPPPIEPHGPHYPPLPPAAPEQ